MIWSGIIGLPIWAIFVLYNCLWVVAVLPWVIHDSDVCDMRCYWVAEAVSVGEYASWLKQKQLEMLMEEGRCDVIGDVICCRIKRFDFDWIASKLSIS
jgi:hypothetical protein